MKCRAIPYEGTDPYLFLSYCHKDAPLLYPVFEQIAASGYRVWYDDGNLPGDQWTDSIAAHLENSRAVIAFVSENASNSHNCRSEITFCFELKKKLIPILTEDFPMPRGMYMQLTNVQYIQATQHPTVEAILHKVFEVSEVAACRLPAGSAPMLRGPEPVQPEKVWAAPDMESVLPVQEEPKKHRMRFTRKKTPAASLPLPADEEILPEEPYTPTEDAPAAFLPVRTPSPEELLPEEPQLPEPEAEAAPEEILPEKDDIPEIILSEEAPDPEFFFPEISSPAEENQPDVDMQPASSVPDPEYPDENARFEAEWKICIPLEELKKTQEADTPSEPAAVAETPAQEEALPEIPDLSDIPDDPFFPFFPGSPEDDFFPRFPEIPEISDLPEDPADSREPFGLLIRLSDRTVFPLTGRTVTVGRDEAYSRIVLPGNTCISKHHITLTVRKNRIYIEDAFSKNGTWVNGEPLEPGNRTRIASPAMLRLFDEDLLLICEGQVSEVLKEGSISFLTNAGRTAVRILDAQTLPLDRNHIWPDGTLADSNIHRSGHAEVRCRRSGFFLSNVAPIDGNATWLNGRKLQVSQTVPLNSGDTIQLGSTKLTFLSVSMKEIRT